RMALLILLIARLLADQHQTRAFEPFAGDDLRRVLVERAARARGLRRGEAFKRFDSQFGHGALPLRRTAVGERGFRPYKSCRIHSACTSSHQLPTFHWPQAPSPPRSSDPQ